MALFPTCRNLGKTQQSSSIDRFSEKGWEVESLVSCGQAEDRKSYIIYMSDEGGEEKQDSI